MTSETAEKQRKQLMGLPKIVLYCIAVNLIGGLGFGYAIGFVAIYTSFNTINTDCTKIAGETACKSLNGNAQCTWSMNHNGNMSCLYTDYQTNPCEDLTNNQTYCLALNACRYDEHSNVCSHEDAWTSAETGIFAGAMITGGMVGSLVASKLISVLGVKKSLLLTGTIYLVASALFTGGQAANSYALLVISRIVLGVGTGVACVVCPMYVGEMVPENYAGPVGVLFQIGCTFGIFLCAALGLAIQPPKPYVDDMKMQLRFQMLVLLQWICSALFIPLGLLIPAPTSELAASEAVAKDAAEVPGEDSAMISARKDDGINKDGSAGNFDDGATLSWGQLLPPIIGSIALCAAQQLTGINAIMNYAPTITKSAGLEPLVGNFVVMLWNFLTTLVAIPLSKKVTPRKLFLVGSTICSVACFLTGIAVYPGVISAPTTKHVLAGLGIIIFIASFEIGMGSTFWIHAQALFPGKYRGPGCSFTLVFQFILNIIINIFFPISLVALSGGASGNPDKGMGIVFMIFGGFGSLAVVVMLKFLRPAKTAGSDIISPDDK